MINFITSSLGYLNPSNSDQFTNFYKMKEFDEVRGPFWHLEARPEGLLALIANVPVLLPHELEGELRDRIGKDIAVLRLDGYRVKAI